MESPLTKAVERRCRELAGVPADREPTEEEIVRLDLARDVVYEEDFHAELHELHALAQHFEEVLAAEDRLIASGRQLSVNPFLRDPDAHDSVSDSND